MQSRIVASSLASAVVLTMSTIGAISPAVAEDATAEVVAVDVGGLSPAGISIIGTGQNLPSMNFPGDWDIGPEAGKQVIAYQVDSAQADKAAVAAAAVQWTRSWLKRACPGVKPAAVRNCRAMAVFDVDDTLVDDFVVGLRSQPTFTYDPAVSNQAVATCEAPVNEPVRQAYEIFRSWGVATAIVTGRSQSQQAATMECLGRLGMSDWDSLTFRPSSSTGPAADYKKAARAGLVDNGWKIGPSIGDQISDMSYGSLGRGFLLPNVRYYLH